MDTPSPRFFDPYAEIRHTRNTLPHWQQPGATYFITFRLADAVPAQLRALWIAERRAWRAHHPPPFDPKADAEYRRRFGARLDRHLDAGHGACVLRAPACRSFLITTFEHLNGSRYWLHAWVIMPNHAHVLVSLHPDASLEQEVGAWKSVSSRRINRHLRRSGALWQEDYFDRLVRDEKHFANCFRYIRENPHTAGLREGEYAYGEGAPPPR